MVFPKPDFGGYASKNDLKCSDGVTIRSGAFKHQSGKKVPLVWNHQYDTPSNIIGYAVLEDRPDGVYARGYFNDTEMGETAKQLVMHGDVQGLSIYANKLRKQGQNVMHGEIREVSLVLAGANPGAMIDTVTIQHGDGSMHETDEAILYTGEGIDSEVSDIEPVEESEETPDEESTDEDIQHADTKKEGDSAVSETKERTIKDVYDDFSQEEKDVVAFMVGTAVEEALKEASSDDDAIQQSAMSHFKEGFEAAMNVFDQDQDDSSSTGASLTHSQLETILKDAQRLGSLKESFLSHADEYGIEDIDHLFPDAKALSNSPELISRRMEWVADVFAKVKKQPFSRIKSLAADITADEARAKGYVKGNLKKDEIVKMLKRVTTPTTVYKKQKLDRDDIVDITEIDIVAWLKAEMRLMLDEEIARAILVGDGREVDDEDKIDEDHLRPIAYDIDMYVHRVNIDVDQTPSEIIEAIVRARRYYKGTGTPTLYTTDERLTDMILDKDTLGRRFYNTEAELAAALRVDRIVIVEAMESNPDIVGIIVNLTDYTIGATKGGEISMFDDFDIDYNQQKYLIETRISGALTKPKSAIVLRTNPGNIVEPTAPTFNNATGVVTIPTVTGVVYKNAATNTTLSAGAQSAIAVGATIEIEAVPAEGYSFPHGFDADWEFTRTA